MITKKCKVFKENMDFYKIAKEQKEVFWLIREDFLSKFYTKYQGFKEWEKWGRNKLFPNSKDDQDCINYLINKIVCKEFVNEFDKS